MRSRFSLLLVAILAPFFVYGQAIFAHNDYVKPTPFYKAFELKAEYIEADIFFENEKLLVAHTKGEIDPAKTLESMYLKPLSEKVKELYELHLMIDIKSDATPTLKALVHLLEGYPHLISSDSLFFVISGNYPPPSEWKNYPSYIWFDGRPNVKYSQDQVSRLKLVSINYPGDNTQKMKDVIDFAHSIDKPVRFWGSPDFEEAWKKFVDLDVDIINTDKPEEVSRFILTLRSKSRHSR